ncbi:hypothetical protein SIO70_00280 [Chitinophaga sancti]|uniref:hypothetical protein n=1 Tax=Chitinophaga sancti TaxID=1004 RepID=UPI002A74D4E8|nr:hypothetical protein [Chitinophaga sancti]WPQ63299.1 hypothetical protein SIO70_00280 [Chitinophaga sancti]
MITSKILTLSLFITIILATNLIVIQLLTRKVKSKYNSEGTLKLAVGLWISILFIVVAIITSKSANIFYEAYDQITIKPDNLFPVLKVCSIFTGLGITWFIIWFYVTRVFSLFILGPRNESKEAESNNVAFFILRGSIFLGFMICLNPAFETLLRSFLPTVEIPFYH